MDHNHAFPITIHCSHCRGESVSRDGICRWDVDTQEWELSGVLDQGYCDDCGGETRLVERHLDGSPVSKWDKFYDE